MKAGQIMKFTEDEFIYKMLEPNKSIFEDLAYCEQMNGDSAGKTFTMQQRYLVPLKNFLPATH